MSSQNLQSDSYCVGGRHRSGTKNLVGELRNNKKNRYRDQIISWTMHGLK